MTREHYSLADIVKCMRISARMLAIADNNNPRLSSLNVKQSELLTAAADDLEAQESEAKR